MRPNTNTNRQLSVTRFVLGQTYVTPGVEEALMIAGQTGIEFLRRHMSQDWGELSDEERKTFEDRLARSAGLRAEVEQTRELLDLLDAANEEAIVRYVNASIQQAIDVPPEGLDGR